MEHIDNESNERKRLIPADDKWEANIQDKTEHSYCSPVTYRRVILRVVISLYVTAYAMGMPIQYQYIYSRVEESYANGTLDINISACDVNTSDPVYQLQQKVQAESSSWILYFSLASGIPAIFSNIICGSYSDALGRKFLFILFTLGTTARIVVLSCVIYFKLNISFLYIGYGLEGISGYLFNMLLVSFAYTADITDKGKGRTMGIAIVEALIGIFLSIATFGTGYFIKYSGFFYPSVTSLGILLIQLCLIIFALPETVPKDLRRNLKPSKRIKSVFGMFVWDNGTNRRRRNIICILSFFFGALTTMGRMAIETLYQLNSPFCWDPVQIGYFGAIRSAIQQVVGMASIKFFQYFMRDEYIGIIGAISAVASFTFEAFSTKTWMLYLAPVIGICANILIPMIRSLMSHMGNSTEQGSIFAAIAAVETICNIFASVIFNNVYTASLTFMKGMVFLVMAAMNIVALIFITSLRFAPHEHENMEISVN